MTRLALVMIARDEAPRIARALDSARPHVERMIVLDTGSADDTGAVAAAHGAEVHALAWRDDFSAARNAALALSDAAWNLVLDADEWVEDPTGLAALPTDGGFLGLVQVASRIAQGETVALSRSWIPRLLPRGARYHGRIHEQPHLEGAGRRRLDVRLGHDGYLPESLARKADRNAALLRREQEAAPDDGYLWFQLGREHHARSCWADAADAFVRALALTPARAAWRHPLVLAAVTALKQAGRLEEAMILADAETPNWPESADFFFVLGDLYLDAAARHPEHAVQHLLPVAESAWKRCLDIGERDDLEGSVAGRGSHLAAHNLAVMYATVGLEEAAAEYRAMADRLRGEPPIRSSRPMPGPG